jgi:hypothetical protein
MRITAVAQDQEIHVLAVREDRSVVSAVVHGLRGEPPVWAEIPALEAITDVACGQSADGRPVCYASDAEGGVYAGGPPNAGVWDDWILVKERGTEPRLSALTVVNRGDADPLVSGIDVGGGVYRRDSTGSWQPLGAIAW